MDEKELEMYHELSTRLSVAETQIKGIYKKIDKIEENTTWILRIIIGAVILGILGFFYNF